MLGYLIQTESTQSYSTSLYCTQNQGSSYKMFYTYLKLFLLNNLTLSQPKSLLNSNSQSKQLLYSQCRRGEAYKKSVLNYTENVEAF